MKKIILLLLAAALSHVTYSQTNCAAAHRIFALPTDRTPTVVTKLGSYPQFGPCRHVTSPTEYFGNLKGLSNDPKYRDEINSLFRAIGYNGVSDPKFTIDKIQATTIPFGAIGNLGDSKHNYLYSILALKGEKNIKCWRIKSANNCNLYFMDECGNAFFYSNAPIERETVKYVERCTGNAKLKVKVIARYAVEKDCQCNDCCDTKYETVEVNESLLASEKINNIPVTNANASYPVKKIYIDVDKATFKRLKDYDVNGKYDKHTCGGDCDESCSHSCEEETSACDHNCSKHGAGCNKSCEKK